MEDLFERMRNMDPDPVDAILSTRMLIRISLTDPGANISINGRSRPVAIDFGSANGRADMEIKMSADTLHFILLDEYSVKKGFSNGELKVRGPIWKALSFSEIFQKGRTFYPDVLRDNGLM